MPDEKTYLLFILNPNEVKRSDLRAPKLPVSNGIDGFRDGYSDSLRLKKKTIVGLNCGQKKLRTSRPYNQRSRVRV